MGISLKPLMIVNHRSAKLLPVRLPPKTDKDIVLRRAYFQLVTEHNYSPAKARQILGLPAVTGL